MTLRIEQPAHAATPADSERFIIPIPSVITNPTVRRWLSKCFALCKPDSIYL